MAMIIGLTGGIASGKSTVANMLREQDIPVVDADEIARQVVLPGERAYEKIIQTFGQDIVLADGMIDRPKLGAIVFHNEEKRLQLNAIVHPAVRAEMKAQQQHHVERGADIVVLDIPLLFESNLTYMVDKVLLVYVTEDLQCLRLMQRNSFTEEEARARIQSQWPLAQKRTLADEIIDNNGTIEETRLQLHMILEKWDIKK